jgi:uncharacterized protein YkwD
LPRLAVAVSLVAAMFAVGVVAPNTTPSALANQGPSAAEAHALELINAERERTGRVALQWDRRAADVAQWRSDVQAADDQMIHDLQGVAKRFEDKGIVWWDLGEALLFGTPRTAIESAEEAYRTWRASDPHWDLLSSTGHDYNYIALGMARAASGWYYWTAIVFEGPDRTPPVASMASVKTGQMNGGKRSVTVSWSGEDVRLFAHTSGLRDYVLQRRVGSGDWVTVAGWTTANSKTFDLDPGTAYKFRVKARDKSGNRGAWSAPLSVTP